MKYCKMDIILCQMTQMCKKVFCHHNTKSFNLHITILLMN